MANLSLFYHHFAGIYHLALVIPVMKLKAKVLGIILLFVSLALPCPVRAASKAVLAYYMPWFTAKPWSESWGWHWTMDHFNSTNAAATAAGLAAIQSRWLKSSADTRLAVTTILEKIP